MLTILNRTIATLVAFAQLTRKRHEQIRAQRVLDSLPEYLRKDIGWPDRELERETRVSKAKSSVWNAETMLAQTRCPAVFGSDEIVQARKCA